MDLFKILYWTESQGYFTPLHTGVYGRTMRYEAAHEQWEYLKEKEHHNNFFGLPPDLREVVSSGRFGTPLDFVFTGTEFFMLIERT
jgi:hypothetical protein